jgi:UDP-hydrolysing UDP-N-acetyl-D-glucosamine 2-epimerase
MRKILIVTGTRAEYGLLKKLIFRLQLDNEIETSVAVTGTHLSKQHGMTIDLIVNDQVKNIHQVDLKIEGDTPVELCDGIGIGLTGFSRLFTKLRPDLVVLLGDRYELWGAAIAATIANVPIAHIHGGESTEGLIDEAVRHSITKMSHLHFCSHDVYKKRIIKMGESPDRVWNVGAVGLDRIRKIKYFSKEEIGAKLGTPLAGINILCTFHPVTLDETQSANEIQVLVNALTKIITNNNDAKVFITLPNADTFSGHIRAKWQELIANFPDKIYGFVNLGDQLYLSLMKEVNVVLGNSSSGILEAPFLKKAVVDIGRRQEGRLRSPHVLHSDGSAANLESILKKSISNEFQAFVQKAESIYGDGHSVEKIYQILKNQNLNGIIFKKFYDGELV